MSTKGIKGRIKRLCLKDRAMLAEWIVESLDVLSEAELEGLWVEDAERRLEDLEQGLVAEAPADDVLRRTRVAIP